MKKSAIKNKQKPEPKVLKGEIVDSDYPSFESQTTETDAPAEDIQDWESLGEGSPDSSTKNLPAPVERALEPSSKDPLLTYLAEIRKYPLLSREEELSVAKRYFETKDPKAAQILVQSNLRFVVKVAAEYSKFGNRMIDLIQEGNVGLMHAVKEYNPYKGARLITYAVWWIRGYIQEYLMKQYSVVRIGTTQNQRKLFYQLQKEIRNLEQLGKSSNSKELSERLGIPEEEVQIMTQRMSGRDVSLDKPLDEDSSFSLGDLQKQSTEETLEETLARNEQLEILKEKIEELRPLLNDKEKIILEERLLNDEPLTLQEIGSKYGITREAVRQAEARLMKKIKERMSP